MNDQAYVKQLSKAQAILFHLYPGAIIVLSFVVLTPILGRYHYPPQLAILASIILVAIPLFISHLSWARKKEYNKSFWKLNAYKKKLSTGKLILYSVALVVFMFLVWGVTQPIDRIISAKLLGWLPGWFTVQNFDGYTKKMILITLVINLIVNGFLAPFFEEFYFRGYLLPRMAAWGKWAFVLNAVLFSFYHFWQPYVYFTLILSLTPMVWLVWKTKDLRLAILTHCLLNIVGALLSFGLILK
ncbi:MAG TPA: CPBP family intramembrane glutamic endopeptidase [Chitinophagaceae bacterium]|nr:CPBP family intramembrane glutamic endopeptidase [Chitinophagaceae bacterium]